MKLFVGLDVSSEKLDACFMTDDSTCSVLKEASYGNSQLGASQIGMATLFLTKIIRCCECCGVMAPIALDNEHPRI